jgi:SAM-dependent methyltransferase
MRIVLLTVVAFGACLAPSFHARERSRQIQYEDLPRSLQEAFSAAGIAERDFTAYVHHVETETDRRVAAGEREHLVYYALQSSHFTDRPRIEPAISALRFVEHLSQTERQRLLDDPVYLPSAGWPSAERARMSALLTALRTESTDPRLAYFRQLLRDAANTFMPEALYPDYVRVARFLYRKEFVAGGTAPADVAQVARLYHERPHSSDTQIEAGFGVYLGLGTLRALDPGLRIARVLVVGPGLDLAPRTDLTDIVAPQSYQPFAVTDALLALSLAAERDLHVHSVDVNMRVVRTLQAAAQSDATLHVFTGIVETADRPFRAEYRTYVCELGRAIGDQVAAPRAITSDPHYRHSIAVRPAVTRAMSAERLNIITERLIDGSPFDLIVATNVLTYFDDRQLALAMSNMARMLRPGGYLLHNESRAGLVETADRLGLSLLHTRSTILGGPEERPFYDVIWLHQRKS